MDFREALEVLDRDPLVVYGWDPDSFLAAVLALYARRSERARLSVSTSWRPRLRDLERLAVDSRDSRGVVLLGTAWDGTEVDLLAPMVLAPVAVIDVHWTARLPRRPNVVFANPAPRGDPRGHWPSTTALLSMLYSNPHPFLAAASIVAVMEGAARSNRVYQNMMALAGLDPNMDYAIARDCALQSYGVASMGDPHTLSLAPKSIVEADPDPCKALLRDSLVTSLRAEAELVLAELVVDAEERLEEALPGVYTVEAEGEGAHSLALARALSQRSGGETVVVAYRDRLKGRNTLCAWSPRLGKPLARLYTQLRTKGYGVSGLFQGPVNTVCIESDRPRPRMMSDFIEAYRARYAPEASR